MTAQMKSIEKIEKALDASVQARVSAHEPAPSFPQSGFGFANVQQAAGNLAVQRWLRSGMIHAKLIVSQPDDPYEQEADRIAEQVVSSKPVAIVQRKSATCSEDTTCPQCEKEGRREEKEQPGQTPQMTDGPLSSFDALRSSSQPLPASIRTFFEPRFRQDFSGVRVHTDGWAANSARTIGARAYTFGRDIVFGTGEFSPESLTGKKLLAHELAHSIQYPDAAANRTIQHQVASPAAAVRRQLDPSNPMAWSWFEPEHRRREFRQEFEGTLAAAPEASLELEQELAQSETVPEDPHARDRWRHEFEQRIKRLVRLNALGLMASHRASIEYRRDQLLNRERLPEQERQFGTPRDSAQSVRDAARVLQRMNNVKEKLEASRSNLHGVAVNALTGCWSLGSCVDDWVETIYRATRRYETEEIRAYLAQRAETLQRGVPSNIIRAFFRLWADNLVAWRTRQIAGVSAGIAEMYRTFPMFKTLDLEDVTSDPDYSADEALLQAVGRAYNELINDVNEAIVEIGSGDIHPFDLPEAVRLTREGLPTSLLSEFDSVFRNHAVIEFWKTLGLSVAQVVAVFIPVVGPAIALTIGAVTTALDIESLLDRVELAQASVTPGGETLGVHGPSPFDYALVAIEVILTAADMRAFAAELRGVRPPLEFGEPHGGAPEVEGIRVGNEAEPIVGHVGAEPEPGQLGPGAGGGEPPSRVSEATGKGSPLERSVHERARRTGSELTLDDGTHGISVYGTGEMRGFQFCSDDCSELLHKLSSLVDALPSNYPDKDIVSKLRKLRDHVGLANKQLRSGAIIAEEADRLSQEFAQKLNDYAARDWRVNELLQMNPNELAARSQEIHRGLAETFERGRALSEAYHEVTTRAGRSQTTRLGERSGSARSALERNVLDEFGITDVGQARRTPGGRRSPEHFEVGNFGHTFAEQLIPDLPHGLDPEVRIRLEDGTIRRADRVLWNDRANPGRGGTVYEIKPNTGNWPEIGQRQAELYAHYLSELYGGEWRAISVTYDAKAVRRMARDIGYIE